MLLDPDVGHEKDENADGKFLTMTETLMVVGRPMFCLLKLNFMVADITAIKLTQFWFCGWIQEILGVQKSTSRLHYFLN